ncbi:MAG: hypothetical protein COS85_02020 [Armatimonadetes bacterium CG07_land_8_20_14_0_80_59_28]|nr:MAG: hypothetical protein COS85_02020 [Armatimonadetes bacterium CG07_land_8_20_14_0_80_59_28]PIX39927.1 MAG: hypothetical protein COZ56_16140 [Armatimonadetes bacterium CG_4_8_14_3_um_filter_58_9]PIY47768.1 MAG: hypothetical protein COZ05_04620 [Armatimonadetes bacterium CG_4_10_14_3_um_filter_59_10]PJB62280.1 MAG: hypothetical protein CO095_18805 [Armatimonadetes bacterium CG_4_9_14_3_um_filter_58_7]
MFTIAMLGGLLVSLASAAQQEGGKRYGLNLVLETALSNHPSLRGEEARVDASRAQLRQAKAGYSPRLDASLGYTQLDRDPQFAVPPFGTLIFGETDNKQADLTAQYPLWTGGKLEGVHRQARAGLEAAHAILDRQRQKVVLNASTSYFSVLKSRGVVRVMESQLSFLQAQRNDIVRMVEQGVGTRIDLLRAETAVSASEEGLTRARNGESVAVAALANAMGLAADHTLTVVESPSFQQLDRLPQDLSEAIAEALAHRPEVAQVAATRKGALAGIQVAKSSQRPTVGLFAQYDAERPTFMPETGDWSAGIALKMNIFDGGGAKTHAIEARAQVKQIEAALEELRNGVTLQVTQAMLNVNSAAERIKTAQKAVATADEGVRLITLGYKNGVNTITDLLAAQSELTGARTDQNSATFDWHTARSELQYALGRDEVR